MHARVERAAGPAPEWTEERVTALVRALQRPLEAYLAALGCPAARIPDLVQDGFLALVRAGFREHGEGSNAAYLRRVVRNAWFKSLRRAPATPADVDALDAAWAEYERDDEGEAYLAALRACVQALPQRERDALSLQYGADVPRAEIARRVGLSEGGLKSVLAASKRRLRECVERRLA